MTEKVSFMAQPSISIAESIIDYVQGHEHLFSTMLYSKHDVKDSRFQFATASLRVDMVEFDDDHQSGLAHVSYGIHFFWPCNNQDEIDTFQEKLPFEINNNQIVFTLKVHQPWVVL
ncbi:hypothetical protein C0Z01_21615 [Photobacterium kishitanii]|uniref:Uncharacterized protein n=1 Tax=Photobacterium kishitanii TaxID=318456 RepID=A0A0B7JHN7_9GAMM|nr:hypothetical protein [Photobacterium kishitanii]OBU27145.1 hypothetical protein AYY22_02525 [Photobacterium kishitanii]PSU87682.1 hypothetical protein C0W42_15345 [Photobacterium kishitanii]PSU96539.1 hypothetical protein C9J27_16495 [Photobacterium kishitanii]PSW62619.1 hypothetical protein C0Z01_21615 [Photobacterium kishitanii]CEO40803.1 conserved hypothetical protein [Photobacterium kishitanii]